MASFSLMNTGDGDGDGVVAIFEDLAATTRTIHQMSLRPRGVMLLALVLATALLGPINADVVVKGIPVAMMSTYNQNAPVRKP